MLQHAALAAQSLFKPQPEYFDLATAIEDVCRSRRWNVKEEEGAQQTTAHKPVLYYIDRKSVV